MKGLDQKQASTATMQRLPPYLRYLKEKSAEGQEYISSVAIAEYMDINPMVVKKDIAVASSLDGKPKIGFHICTLITDIEKFLGYDDPAGAVLVGAGQLGKTLLSYEGFSNYGLDIKAAFDVNVETPHKIIKGRRIYPMEKLKEYIAREKIQIGIITVPKSEAQAVCDLLTGSGVKAVWNFAPTFLKVPPGVTVKNEDMAASLAILSEKLKRRGE